MTHFENMPATELMTISEREGRIVHAKRSQTIEGDLLADCDGNVDTKDDDGNKITEYWTETWRVHLHHVPH